MDLQAVYKELGAVLAFWVVIPIILEQCFLALFEWKIFKKFLDGKGLKFPI